MPPHSINGEGVTKTNIESVIMIIPALDPPPPPPHITVIAYRFFFFSLFLDYLGCYVRHETNRFEALKNKPKEV